MDMYTLQSPWPYLPNHDPFLFHANNYNAGATPHNYVHWTQTPDSHHYTADLPGVRKEEIRVELEGTRYLVIRTERDGDDDGGEMRINFMRKFRLPELVDVDGISAKFEDGVLTIIVPRATSRRRLMLGIEATELPNGSNAGARAA